MEQYYTTIIATLATYGVSTILVEYNGYKDLFVKLRTKVKVFRCVICTAVWLGAVICFLIGLNVFEYLAVLGGILLLDRFYL